MTSYVPAGSYSAEVASALDGHGDRVFERAWGNPQTVIHGDLRLDNLYFDDSVNPAEPIFFDWGVAAHGNAVYDLAYFLGMGIDSITLNEEMALLDEYLERIEDSVPDYRLDQLIEDYRYALLYIFHLRLKAIEMSTGLPDTSPLRAMRLKTYERISKAIERNDCLSLLADK